MPRKLSVNWETIKTLVTIYGARETARRTGLNVNTVTARATRNGWKRAILTATSTQSLSAQSPSEALQTTLTEAKNASTVALATYTERATKAAASHAKPLDIARKVRDVSAVYGALWPTERRSEIIQASILLNPELVSDAEETQQSGGVVEES